MKVSVITINYNHSKQLEATIRSVVGNAKMLGNAFEEEVEYIVIDGGSTDSPWLGGSIVFFLTREIPFMKRIH